MQNPSSITLYIIREKCEAKNPLKGFLGEQLWADKEDCQEWCGKLNNISGIKSNSSRANIAIELTISVSEVQS